MSRRAAGADPDLRLERSEAAIQPVMDAAERVGVESAAEAAVADTQVVEPGAAVDPERVVLLGGRHRLQRVQQRLMSVRVYQFRLRPVGAIHGVIVQLIHNKVQIRPTSHVGHQPIRRLLTAQHRTADDGGGLGLGLRRRGAIGPRLPQCGEGGVKQGLPRVGPFEQITKDALERFFVVDHQPIDIQRYLGREQRCMIAQTCHNARIAKRNAREGLSDEIGRGEDPIAGIEVRRIGRVRLWSAVGGFPEDLRPYGTRIAGEHLQQGGGGFLTAEVTERVGRVARPLRVVEKLDQRRQRFRPARPAQGAQPSLHPPFRCLVSLVLDGCPGGDRVDDPFNCVSLRPQRPRRSRAAFDLMMTIGGQQRDDSFGQAASRQRRDPGAPVPRIALAFRRVGQRIEGVLHSGQIGQGHPRALAHGPIGIIQPARQGVQAHAAATPSQRQRSVAPHPRVRIRKGRHQRCFGRVIAEVTECLGGAGAHGRNVVAESFCLLVCLLCVGINGNTGLPWHAGIVAGRLLGGEAGIRQPAKHHRRTDHHAPS